MRLMVAAFLMGSMLCMPALATEKPAPVVPPAAEAKPEAAKPEAPKPETTKPAAKPLHVPANKPVDYGDMRCAFAVRHRDVLDSQIIAWAGGFLEGYARANPEHVNNARLTELTDPSVLRTHIRGYCLKHKEKSIEAALLAMMPRAAHPTETPVAPAPHPAAPAPQKPAPPKPQ
ncbi:hypothetical protein GCM10007874_57150 [Labrys miyagiensis]|uniref:HdeA/HdeB family protein n=1 Tax=Labrys miyagiensis TaxID=346912 RepID=A0ABQ6CSB2_9HYPH|nr:hypothetical protein [Labrys miyagiensis]GLS22695.1 hypothetical protein GCM10007874_57150 [Labrys miyagiensis]